MSSSKNNTNDLTAECQRVEQETPYFCGAACCEMLFDSRAIASTQSVNYELIHDNTRFSVEQMYSDPTGMTLCLNSKFARSINFDFKAFVTTATNEALRELVYTVAKLGVPCACLVQNGNHWVVVDDVRIIADSPSTIDVCGVFIQNPWFNSTPNKYVGVDEFMSGWLTPNKWGITWKDTLIVLSDGNSHPFYEVQKAQISSGKILRIEYSASAASSLQSLLKRHGFFGFNAIAGGGASITNPILVTELPGPGHYVIAPMDASADPRFGGFVYVAVGGETGELLEISSFSKALEVCSDDEAKSYADSKWGANGYTIFPDIYWERNYSSMSRFRVHRRVNVSGTIYKLFGDGTVEASNDERENAGG